MRVTGSPALLSPFDLSLPDILRDYTDCSRGQVNDDFSKRAPAPDSTSQGTA
jgi:hypothetical protein